MIRFADPQFLVLLSVVPLLALLYWMGKRRRRAALAAFGNMELVSKLSESSSPGKRGAKAALFLTAMTLFTVAAARPQIGTRMEMVKREGIDVVIAVDTSTSMNAEDATGTGVSRINKAKHEIEALLDVMEQDRVGLVAFAGTAQAQCPLTLDYEAVKIFLKVIDTDLIPVPGTAVGSAVEMAVKMFDKNEKKYKAIILITDGEDHVSDPMKAAELARKNGVRIFPIGVGSPLGTPLPVYDDKGNKTGMKKDKNGEIVMSRMDEVMLEKMALTTGGRYYPATLGEIELKKIREDISGMEKKVLAARRYSHYEDRFQIFLVLGLFLLLIESLITTRAKEGKIVGNGNGNGIRAALLLAVGLMCLTSSGCSVLRDDYWASMTKGNLAYAEKKYDDALKAYNDAKLSKPESAALRHNTGNAFYKKKDYGKALENYTKAADSKELSIAEKARYNMGNAYFRQDKFEESISQYKQALDLAPDDVEAKYNLELARIKLKEKLSKQNKKKNEENKMDKHKLPDKKKENKNCPNPKQGQGQKKQPQPKPAGGGQQKGGMTKEQTLQALKALDNKEKDNKKIKAVVIGGGARPDKDW